ncbi:hypothetical protein EAI89_06770 [Eubacterium sp. am_0171]|uniref:Uncharacterized protein n=1 Tax=Faecalicatena contorta TaxID=39482 RepID=A0A174CKW4_9FIRM|nr:hypothetical protein [Faecalicatena contorta]MSC84349.1 hypothetical protein [Eubacterium sp. BIOML-A1]MSD05895.1 hypothetical protein [Eubacterium sp. BIOML-A2]RYT23266.1 hypothetical protein EAI89_06770 [Eubacterium sp. am_0171]CUO13734.1 Uncharacterised protein [[Eubacterium] contortum] [Faecalicatena contorta]
MQKENQEQKKPKPVTVRIDEFKTNLNRVVAESQLPPFLLEMLLGEYLAGVSQVAKQEYAQDRAEWEKAGELDGGYKQGD